MTDKYHFKTILTIVLLLSALIGIWLVVLSRYTDWLPSF